MTVQKTVHFWCSVWKLSGYQFICACFPNESNMFVLVTFYQNVISCTASISANVMNPSSVPLFQTPGSDRIKSSPILHFFLVENPISLEKCHITVVKCVDCSCLLESHRIRPDICVFSVLQVSSSCVPVANYELVRTSVVS